MFLVLKVNPWKSTVSLTLREKRMLMNQTLLIGKDYIVDLPPDNISVSKDTIKNSSNSVRDAQGQ